MNWFKNQKISFKILSSFGLISFIAAVIGFVGYSGLMSANESVDEIGLVRMPSIKNLLTINAAQNAIIVGERGLINTKMMDPVIRERQYESISNQYKIIDEAWALFDASPKTKFEQELWEQFVIDFEAFKEKDKDLIELSREKDELISGGLTPSDPSVQMFDDIVFQMSLQASQAYEKSNDVLEKIIAENQRVANEFIAEAQQRKNSDTIRLILFLILGVAIAVALGFIISRMISNPLTKTVAMIKEMEKGHLSTRLNLKSTDEVGALAETMDRFAENLQTMTKGIDRLSKGDLTVNFPPADELDEIAPALNKTVETLQEVKVETDMLTAAALNGELDKKGNSEKFEGGYREIIEGFNNTLDAIETPIRETETVLQILSTGDLTATMEGSYKGNFKRLQDYVNNLGSSLSSLIKDVTESIQATASASTQISSSAEEMAAGSQEQSAQSAEVAIAVEQMTRTIIETTQNASKAAETSNAAKEKALEGGQKVSETVSGMVKIAEVVNQAAETIKELGKSSDQIGEIISVINDIADQTNLLALNAAIEAARAGEQGRGFAVVADEVRKLAERTTKATKEIAGMIEQIQKDTEGAVTSISRGTEEVDNGKEMTRQVGEAYEEIIEHTTNVGDVINQVAAASEEQSATAEEISRSIETITTVSQESASGVQQVANASEDLNRLTVNLQELISRFKIAEQKTEMADKVESDSEYWINEN
ncbi:MAG: HAMP domain-containing protein [Ignavibacteriae bacterium]|nr:methyl-accepting chemotaxis protein [Ignavibacteriota bacterium]NOG97118.1 HAMP domain-containing protein [Ignavibacteriota bacterium]